MKAFQINHQYFTIRNQNGIDVNHFQSIDEVIEYLNYQDDIQDWTVTPNNGYSPRDDKYESDDPINAETFLREYK